LATAYIRSEKTLTEPSIAVPVADNAGMTGADTIPSRPPQVTDPGSPPEKAGVLHGSPSVDRSLGLDVFRGLVVGWLFVVVYTPTSGLRGHAEWFGWDHSDVFFPMFLLLAGMGLAMQSRRGMPWQRLRRRFVSLFVLGLAVNAWLGAGPDFSQLRLLGVLQRIAIAGLVGAVIVALVRRRWWAVLAAAVVTALAWGIALAVASRGCLNGLPSPDGCGTFYFLDLALFGESHVYGDGQLGHDPEGLASTVGALATFLAGYAAAALLDRLRGRAPHLRAAALLAMAASWAVLLPAFLLLQPVAKRLWTPSFVALHAVLGIAVLAACVLLFDSARSRWGRRAAVVTSWPFVALGRNALVLWVGVFVVGKVLQSTTVGDVPLGTHLLQTYGAVGYFLLTAGVWWLVAALMHMSRWYVRF
jgi:predicted acyltransferase